MRYASLVLLLVLVGGCAKPAGPVFEPLAAPLVWPSPPERARITYVGQLSSSADLKPPKDFFEGIGQAIFGKKPVQAMISPFAVCTDQQDRVFIADNGAKLVHVMNLKTRKYTQWKPGRKDRAFEQLVGIAYDPGGRLLVSDSALGTIIAFDAEGKYQGELGAGVMQRPCGIAVQPGTRNIFVADAAAHQVVVLSPDGQLVQRLGQRGFALGEFNYPTNVAFDGQNRLYVSDSMNFRVVQFSPALLPLRQIGGQGDTPGFFGQPKGIALDRDNHLYVVDSRFENVQIFDAEGQLLLYFGEEGSGPGRFWLPAGIFIDANQRVWIADSYNQRIVVMDYLPEGRP